MRNCIFIFLIVIACMVSACKTTRQTPVLAQKDTLSVPLNVAEITEPKDSLVQLKRQQNSWYSSRLSVEISTSGDEEISAFLVNRRDSVIYLNLNKFGIELARAVLTPDSISMVNRFEKTYYKGDYSLVSRLYGFPLSFDFIQSILMGEDFIGFDANSISQRSADSTLLISIPRRTNSQLQFSIHQEIKVLRSTGKIINNWIKDIQTQQVANISYQEFESIDSYIFPKQYSIELPGVKIKVVAKSMKVNVPGPTTLSIPTKYTPMFPPNGN
jgi:hypothetical protein